MPLLLSLGTYLLVACAIVGGAIAGLNALLAPVSESTAATALAAPNKKIGTERKSLPPIVQMKPGARVEVSSSQKHAVPNYAAVAKAQAKQSVPERTKATTARSRRGVPKLSNEAREAYASEIPVRPRFTQDPHSSIY
jgi:hypothetical protein